MTLNNLFPSYWKLVKKKNHIVEGIEHIELNSLLNLNLHTNIKWGHSNSEHEGTIVLSPSCSC